MSGYVISLRTETNGTYTTTYINVAYMPRLGHKQKYHKLQWFGGIW